MYFFVGVENFAKIEMAKVCTNSYTLLVGLMMISLKFCKKKDIPNIVNIR